MEKLDRTGETEEQLVHSHLDFVYPKTKVTSQ